MEDLEIVECPFDAAEDIPTKPETRQAQLAKTCSGGQLQKDMSLPQTHTCSKSNTGNQATKEGLSAI